MNCSQIKDKLEKLLEGLLDDSQANQTKEHLAKCGDCQAEFDELNQLHQRLSTRSKEFENISLENEVADRIIRQQKKDLETLSRENRHIKIWRNIMKSKTTKFMTAAAAIIIVSLVTTIFITSTPAASAATVLKEAIDAVSDLTSVHMKAHMRTRPKDNFGNIGLNYEFVDIEMWKRINNKNLLQWRIEKPGRVLLMDGKTTLMLIRPNYGVLQKQAWPLGCYDSWMGRLLNVRELLDNELQNAKNNPGHEVFMSCETINGQDKIILEVDVPAAVPQDDYLRNKFIFDSDHLKVFQFDADTKLLESLQIYVHGNDEDVLIFEVTDIEYNPEIDDSVFVLDLPEDMVWSKEPEILADNEKYEKMTPKEAATAFFQACAEENWEEVLKFTRYSKVPDWLKNFGSIEIISIGEPFQSEGYASRGLGWFVPYEIKFKNGHIKKFNLAIRKDNAANRFVVDGGL